MDNTSASKVDAKRGDRFTAPTTMPADMLRKHKLPKDIAVTEKYRSFRNSRGVRRLTRMANTYRLLVHGVVTPHRLAAPLRSTVQYFASHSSRADSDNPRDRKGLNTETVETPVAETAKA